MDVEGNDDGQFNRGADGGAGADEGAEVDGVEDKVVTGADERAHRGQHRLD